MLVYNTYLDKENRSHKILCTDIEDTNSMMIVTLNVPTQLIERHEKSIILRVGISIKNL
jgi:hypothetical protein